MERLTEAFKTRSLAGLFETFWGRCLLWQRAERAAPLKKIPFGIHSRRTPPSWSWMASDGVISFIKPEGGQVDWNDKNITLPFQDHTQASWLRTSHRNDSVAIRAQAFDYDIASSASAAQADLSWDNGQALPSAATKCVIIGSEKRQVTDLRNRIHYVLIVKARLKEPGAVSYERVGVGYLIGKFIDLDRAAVSIDVD
jgi:hypothetical protein